MKIIEKFMKIQILLKQNFNSTFPQSFLQISSPMHYNVFVIKRKTLGGTVLDPSKGVCADPVERVTILEVKGPGPPGGVSEHQLSPDRGGEKT
jgi:hypothetical protein